MAVSTQHLLFCRVFQVIYYRDFLPARKSAPVRHCCVFFMAMQCSPFRRCWDVRFILGPQYLCAVSRCWGIDRAQWWTGGISLAANQKVNSLSIEEGKWPSRPAHLSHKQLLKPNCIWLCLHAYRAAPFRIILLMSHSIPILSFDTFLYQQKISLENLCCHLWNLYQTPDYILFSPSVRCIVFCLHLSTCLDMCICQLKA